MKLFKYLIITTFLFLGCAEETTEEEIDLEQIKQQLEAEAANVTIEDDIWANIIETDPVYSKLVENVGGTKSIRFDIETWVRVFVEDAKRVADLDLAYVLDNPINERQASEVPEGAAGSAFGRCDDNKVDVAFRDNLKEIEYPTEENYLRIVENQFSKTICIYYHELGHDILNLAHTCENAEIMATYAETPKGNDCVGSSSDFLIKNPKLNPIYYYEGFIRARDRMFNMIEQFPSNCNN